MLLVPVSHARLIDAWLGIVPDNANLAIDTTKEPVIQLHHGLMCVAALQQQEDLHKLSRS
jgi:hypothetical protein